VDGLSFLAVIVALGRIRSLPLERAPEEGGWWERLLAGFAYVRGDLRARVLLVLLAVCTIFGWSYLALMPAHAKDVLHLDAAGYGRLLSANGVGAALGALLVAGRPEAATRREIRRRVFGALGLFGSMVVAFAWMPGALLAGAALALAGFGAIAFVSTSNTLIQVAVPNHLRGRVMGIWALVFGGSMPVGSFLIGHLAEATDTPVAIAASGTLCLVLSGLAWLRLPPPRPDSEAIPGSA
jgi:MFS family permease